MKQKQFKDIIILSGVLVAAISLFLIFKTNQIIRLRNRAYTNLASEITTNCNNMKNEIVNLITNANYCTEDVDCTYKISVGYPAKCNTLVNINSDIDKIESLYLQYVNTCKPPIYDCDPHPTKEEIKCVNGICLDSRYLNLH